MRDADGGPRGTVGRPRPQARDVDGIPLVVDLVHPRSAAWVLTRDWRGRSITDSEH